MTAMVLATLAAAGCASDPGQTITGRVNTGSFPETVTHVRAVGSTTVVEARVAADSSFLLTLPAGERYRIEMVSAVRASDLVFPRPATSTLDTSFYIAASGAAFDLGMVTYVKDPDSSTTIFDQGGGGGGDTGTGGGQDTGTGGGQDTGTGGGQDTGVKCGDGAAEPDGGGVSDDGAVAEHTPDQALNCDGDGGGGGQDTGGGGQDTGGGGQDTGGGGGG